MSLFNDTNETAVEERTLTWREPVAILAAVVLVDTTVYHGIGFAGLALLIFVWPLLFLFGVTKPFRGGRAFLFAGLAFLVSLKLVWCGNEVVVLLGLGTVFLFAALQAGIPLHGSDLGTYSVSWFYSAPLNLSDYGRALRRRKSTGWTLEPASRAAIFVPAGLLFVFGLIFVLANPDLQEKVQYYWDELIHWIGRFSDWVPTFMQVCVWVSTAWIMTGLLRPRKKQCFQEPGQFSDQFDEPFQAEVDQVDVDLAASSGISGYIQKRLDVSPGETPRNSGQAIRPQEDIVSKNPADQEDKTFSIYYYTYFNSLVSLILLFGVYLVFEFYKNWSRDFPPGFNYSRHMHKGAAYLTLALALSTLVLCTIFHGKTLLEPRIKTLRRLAVLWTGLNFLLALAVYNRLYIYIDLNGLSRLRITGILGTTAVAIGLIMAVRMILLSQGIRWLVYRYAWSVLAVVFAGYVLPLDWYISHHNVSRVMKGDLAPSIFLFPSESPPEHYLASLPLLECGDEVIREGAKAFFADYADNFRSSPIFSPDTVYQWTAFQWSHDILKNTLESRQEEFQIYRNNPDQKQEAIKTFRKYTNRWI